MANSLNHTKIKPEKLAATAAELMERELVVPKLFARKGIEEFKGAKDDTINVRVPGILPARDYEWRNNRAQPLLFDEYRERKLAVRFGGNAYSATMLTDEQREMDFMGWTQDILPAQSRAVARKLEYGAIKALKDGKYSVTIGANGKAANPAGNVLAAILEARHALNRMGASKVKRTLLVGSDWDTILQGDGALLAGNVGNTIAESAFADALLGKVKGFDIVVSEDIAPDEAYALTGDSFVFLNAAPGVPDSAVAGASMLSQDGIAMRWLRDYDPQYQVERSTVNTWYGYQQVLDPVIYVNDDGQEVVSDDEYNIRSVKLTLGDVATTTKYFPEGSDKAKVAKGIGLTKTPASIVYSPVTGG
mgnify:CR=1 FL=1|jgi:hypothetical protein